MAFIKNGSKTTYQPRRTTKAEAIERKVEKVEEKTDSINVMAILSDQHPLNGEDYAIQLFYKYVSHTPYFKVTEKRIDENNEDAYLVVNEKRYSINIRTAKIQLLG